VPKGGRFVFYFAGHGHQQGYLLANDYAPVGEKGRLTYRDLRNAMLADSTKGLRRSVLIDSCHSRVMIAKGMTPAALVTRGGPSLSEPVTAYDTYKSTVPPQRKVIDPAQDLDAQREVAYFVAADANQLAHEHVFGEKPHGVFTHALCAVLKQTANLSWADLERSVRREVAKVLPNNEQVPHINGWERSLKVFDNVVSARLPVPAVANVVEAIPRAGQSIELGLSPDRQVLAVGEATEGVIRVQKPLVLVALQWNRGGLVKVVGPVARRPEDGDWRFPLQDAEEAGPVSVSAVGFERRENAEAWVAQVKSAGMGSVVDGGKIEAIRASIELPAEWRVLGNRRVVAPSELDDRNFLLKAAIDVDIEELGRADTEERKIQAWTRALNRAISRMSAVGELFEIPSEKLRSEDPELSRLYELGRQGKLSANEVRAMNLSVLVARFPKAFAGGGN
jgi:hypothetical protein